MSPVYVYEMPVEQIQEHDRKSVYYFYLNPMINTYTLLHDYQNTGYPSPPPSTLFISESHKVQSLSKGHFSKKIFQWSPELFVCYI